MSAIADWYTDRLAAYGLIPVTAVEAVICVAIVCATGLAFHLHDRIRDRRALRGHIPAAPDNTPGTDHDLLSACHHIARQTAASRKEKP